MQEPSGYQPRCTLPKQSLSLTSNLHICYTYYTYVIYKRYITYRCIPQSNRVVVHKEVRNTPTEKSVFRLWLDVDFIRNTSKIHLTATVKVDKPWIYGTINWYRSRGLGSTILLNTQLQGVTKTVQKE